MTVDLESQIITTPAGRKLDFTGDPERRAALLEGLDEIGMTLKLDRRSGRIRRVTARAGPGFTDERKPPTWRAC